MTTRPYKAATESVRAEWTPEVREFRERLGEQLTVEAPCPAESRGLCASPYCDGTAAVSAPDLDAIRAEAASLTEDPEFERSLHIGGMEQDLARFVLDRVPALLAALAAAHAENKMLNDDVWQAAQMQREVEDERDEVRAALARVEGLASRWDTLSGDMLRAALAAAASETEEGR